MLRGRNNAPLGVGSVAHHWAAREFSTSIEIHATPDDVFDYLVTEAGMTAWMGQHATLEPHVGGRFQVDIAGSPIRGHYLEIVRPQRVVVSWGLAGSDDNGTARA